MPPTNGLENLAEAVKDRRADLGLTHDQVLTRGGPSGVTLTKIESARGPVPNAATLKKLDTALDWEQGSAKRLITGGEPTVLPVDDARLQRLRDDVDQSRKLFANMLAHYIAMGMRSAKFIENPDDPAVRASQAELADMMRKASRTVAVHFLIQLDPSWNLPEVMETASSVLTEEDQQTVAEARESFLRASALLNHKPGLPAGVTSSPNVTNLADRRPVPPPPDMDDLDVAASRREKRSDGERDKEDGPHELSLSDKKSRRNFKYEFNSGAEAYEYAREFLIAEGEKPHLVDAALGDAGQHIADTSARGWAVRIRKIADGAATSHDDE